MRDREGFVEMACAMGLRAHGNVASAREHAKHLVQSAQALADELGLKEGGEEEAYTYTFTQRDLETELRAALKQRDDRIAELEAQLEQATAPKPKGGK